MSYPVRQLCALAVLICLVCTASADGGTLSEKQRISSQTLGYDLQYWVYRPPTVVNEAKLPSLYVTDGEQYLVHGHFKSILDSAIANGDIEPVLVVFLDSRNPDDPTDNRRSSQLVCNKQFASFFATELIPTISNNHPVSTSRDDRVILGLSLGGLNSACFGLMLPQLFSGIAMQSPANGKLVEVVRKLYEEREKIPIKMYLSVGTINDNYIEVNRFRRTLQEKGYDLTYEWVHRGRHNWKNWGPLLDDILLTFFAKPDQTS